MTVCVSGVSSVVRCATTLGPHDVTPWHFPEDYSRRRGLHRGHRTRREYAGVAPHAQTGCSWPSLSAMSKPCAQPCFVRDFVTVPDCRRTDGRDAIASADDPSWLSMRRPIARRSAPSRAVKKASSQNTLQTAGSLGRTKPSQRLLEGPSTDAASRIGTVRRVSGSAALPALAVIARSQGHDAKRGTLATASVNQFLRLGARFQQSSAQERKVLA